MTSEDDGWESPVQIMDLGLGGARLALQREVEVGAPVRLTMVAPNLWDPLVLHGQVAWTKLAEEPASLVGLRFAHSSGTGLRALADLIASLGFE
jgi:hypothetical protein